MDISCVSPGRLTISINLKWGSIIEILMRFLISHLGIRLKRLRMLVFTRSKRLIPFRSSGTLRVAPNQRPKTMNLEILETLICSPSRNLLQRLTLLRQLQQLRRSKKSSTPLPTTTRNQRQQVTRQSTSKQTPSRPITSATSPKTSARSSRTWWMRETSQPTPTARTISITTSCSRSPIKGQKLGTSSLLMQKSPAASRSRWPASRC